MKNSSLLGQIKLNADKTLKILRFVFILTALALLNGCFPDQASKFWEHTDNAISITLSHDGQYVLIARSQGFVELRTTADNTVIGQWQHDKTPDAGVIAADFSLKTPIDDRLVVTAQQNNLALYSIKQAKMLHFWSLDDIRDIKLSSDGEFALVASRDKHGKFPLYRIVYFHLRTGGIKYAFYHDDIVSTVALSQDGRYALSGSDDTKARLWDLKTGELKHTWPHVAKLSKVQLSPDGNYAMTNAAGDGIFIWDTQSGKLLRKLNKIRATVAAAAFSADSKHLATGYSREQLILWDIQSGKKLKSWKPARRYFWQSSLANITTVAFKDSQTLISETSRGIMQFWKFP
jgi:WD40 repeat protein